jgi:hypothetical protein
MFRPCLQAITRQYNIKTKIYIPRIIVYEFANVNKSYFRDMFSQDILYVVICFFNGRVIELYIFCM